MFIVGIEEVEQTRTINYICQSISSLAATPSGQTKDLDQGWKLKNKKSSVRVSTNMKDFLEECFNTGLTKHRKMEPKEVEKLITMSVKSDGSRRFSPSDHLNWRQINSYFSRLAQKQKSHPRSKRAAETSDTKENKSEFKINF